MVSLRSKATQALLKGRVTIAAWIRERRQAGQVSRNELARRLNVSVKAVESWEQRKREPGGSILLDLLRELG